MFIPPGRQAVLQGSWNVWNEVDSKGVVWWPNVIRSEFESQENGSNLELAEHV